MPNIDIMRFKRPPSVPTIPYFHTIDVPTIGAIQGINKIVLNNVFNPFDGIIEIILARNKVIIILAVTAITQKTTVFFTEIQNTLSASNLL